MIEPLMECPSPSNQEGETGKKMLQEGVVGSIALAGGEGSRLGWGEPKGSFPIGGQSLFEILAEKVKKASKTCKKTLPLAVMTSPRNDKVTRQFFAENDNFGLDAAQLHFFTQEMLSLLDLSKKPLKEKAAAGNGKALHCFYHSGLFEKWKEQGIKYLSIVPIDNPLASPFDPSFLGTMQQSGAEIGVRVVKRLSPEEHAGAIGKKNGKLHIFEYSEFEEARKWPLIHTGLLAFSMPFVKQVAHLEMPLHLVQKERAGKFFLKQETFLFDLLDAAQHAIARLYPRERCFAPLKSPEDIESVCDAYALSVKHPI